VRGMNKCYKNSKYILSNVKHHQSKVEIYILLNVKQKKILDKEKKKKKIIHQKKVDI